MTVGLTTESSHIMRIIISTDSFTKREVQILQKLLLDKFGINTKMYMSLCRGKKYPKLYIGKDGRDMFLKTIKPYILSCFRYKLPPAHIP